MIKEEKSILNRSETFYMKYICKNNDTYIYSYISFIKNDILKVIETCRVFCYLYKR